MSTPDNTLPPAWQAQTRTLGSRREIEAYFWQLNSASPLAAREIARWGSEGSDALRLAAFAMPARFGEGSVFLGDTHSSFASEVRAQQQASAGSPYVVGLVVSGAMRVETSEGHYAVEPGEGVLVDPAQVERSWIEADTRLIEFAVPKTLLQGLGAESAADGSGPLRFEPRISPDLAGRLRFMATEAAQSLRFEGDALFRRWLELIGLTLLKEQLAQPVLSAQGVPLAAPQAVRRALDFIEAHAGTDLVLADIAKAACVSVSSLLRLFERHLGRSPTAVLRELRLDRARDELRRGTAESIREVALRWGFQSPSMFRVAYARRFGETPSETRG